MKTGQLNLSQNLHEPNPLSGLITGKNIDRRSISYSLHGSSSSKMFKAFNGLGVIAFSFGDAMLPEIQVNDLKTD